MGPRQLATHLERSRAGPIRELGNGRCPEGIVASLLSCTVFSFSSCMPSADCLIVCCLVVWILSSSRPESWGYSCFRWFWRVRVAAKRVAEIRVGCETQGECRAEAWCTCRRGGGFA